MSRLRNPCVWALRATVSRPASVTGPVDFFHGFRAFSRAACSARRFGVQALLFAGLFELLSLFVIFLNFLKHLGDVKAGVALFLRAQGEFHHARMHGIFLRPVERLHGEAVKEAVENLRLFVQRLCAAIAAFDGEGEHVGHFARGDVRREITAHARQRMRRRTGRRGRKIGRHIFQLVLGVGLGAGGGGFVGFCQKGQAFFIVFHLNECRMKFL